MKKIIIFSTITALFILPACRLYKLEQMLDPVNAEFLSKVRYIITKKERKIFLELPDSEKAKFIEEFWRRRDPNLETEENEFKMEYFNRIERPNKLFLGEGKQGWLTDRGRIYILFGPPTNKVKEPLGGEPYSRCREVWYYGNFPVVFVDMYCSGTYEMVPIDLSHLHYLNKAQHLASKTYGEEKGFLDFTWAVEKTFIDENRVEGIVTIEIPYKVIWFKSENDKLITTLDVRLELRDEKDNLFWEQKDSFLVKTDDIELLQKQSKNYKMKIPFELEKDLERLQEGKNLMYIFIKNRTGGEESKKMVEFTLRDRSSFVE